MSYRNNQEKKKQQLHHILKKETKLIWSLFLCFYPSPQGEGVRRGGRMRFINQI